MPFTRSLFTHAYSQFVLTLIRNYNHVHTVLESSYRSPYITSLLRIFKRAYPYVYSRLLLVYLASLTRRVHLRALPATCVIANSAVLMEGYNASLPFLHVKEEYRMERTLGQSCGS